MQTQLHLEIPASTANLGCGFDSIGMALNKFLIIDVQVIDGPEWQFIHRGPHLTGLPDDESHYIYKVAQQVAQQFQVTLPALKVKMDSDIPLARGLGSSASALIGALYIANYFGDIQLSQYELLQLATQIEGHPDNVAPTIYGGLVIGYHQVEKQVTRVAHIDVPNVDFVITMPDYELETSEARQALPATLTHQDAVSYSAISNTMISALMQHQYELAGEMMEQDGLHEPYRQPLIRDFEHVKTIAHHYEAYATVISGAGPTILTMIKKEKSGPLVRALNQKIANCHSELVTVNTTGVKMKVSRIEE
ncbi:homoserine kinase [Staphylococcus lutrae]|uniref:Homoserine kinase n=1 Tax=Staphylococcus lutrae TaxID=155085 RepID=A0AAC9RVV0_9STAP|nr:homoserine kinase [Staphylococcus lutrae]ARJ52040.1 homoserine kinase [Staphylococcus lutrae]PNZ35589.1 homoserine kinase [Staphylococcus lutrae]